MLQSRNDTGDKITDHSTLQRLVFMWRQLSLPDMCSRIDLHSFFYLRRFENNRWGGEAWVSWKQDHYLSVNMKDVAPSFSSTLIMYEYQHLWACIYSIHSTYRYIYGSAVQIIKITSCMFTAVRRGAPEADQQCVITHLKNEENEAGWACCSLLSGCYILPNMNTLRQVRG